MSLVTESKSDEITNEKKQQRPIGEYGPVQEEQKEQASETENRSEKDWPGEKKVGDEQKTEIGLENSSKKARQFDLDAMLVESRHTARERCKDVLEQRKYEEMDDIKSGRRLHDICLVNQPSNSTALSNNKYDDQTGSSRISQTVTANKRQTEDNDDEIGPPLPPGFNKPESGNTGFQFSNRDSGVEEDDELLEEEDDDQLQISVSDLIPSVCEASVSHGEKPVTALAVDVQGSKFASGGLDYRVNLYDFARMDSALKPLRETTPAECHVINTLAYSNNGENLLVGSGNPQVRILDRKGTQWADTPRGDQYLIDLTNTKGHTGAINDSMWNPFNKDEFMTCSDDGTVRLWNLADFKEITKCLPCQRSLIKTKNSNGKKSVANTCSYSQDGKLVAAGCDDGTIHVWKYGKIYVNPVHLNRKAHDGPLTSLRFSYGGTMLVSRSLDDTLKLWDMRKFKQPVHVATGLEAAFPMTECGFSPGDELVLTGTSVRPGREGVSGQLLLFDVNNFNAVYSIKFPQTSCIRAQWHPKINQIFAGLSDSTVKIFYDPQKSSRGALQCVSKPVRRQRKQEVLTEQLIMAPLTLQMFQGRGEEDEEKEVTEWRIKKFLRMQAGRRRPDFRKPADFPMSGPSAGGRLADSGGTLHAYVAQQIGKKRNREFLDDKDVRASILRHAKEAEENPLYIQKAYEKTQPKPIFQEKTTGPEEEEVDEELQPVFKMPKT